MLGVAAGLTHNNKHPRERLMAWGTVMLIYAAGGLGLAGLGAAYHYYANGERFWPPV
jgi:hypothetical protein